MTAGADERVLRLLPGTPETEEAAEQRIREELRRRNVGPGGPEFSPPPLPPFPPTVPEQPGPEAGREPGEQPARVRAANDRLVDWWRTDKPALDEPDRVEEPEPDDESDEEPQPEPTPVGRGPRRRRVAKTDGGQDQAGGAGKEQEQEPGGPRWSRPSLGRPPGLPPKRQDLITWWREDVKPHNKWLLYHGTGLVGGLWYGVPQWGLAGAEFVKENDPADVDVLATWGLLGIVLAADYRIRHMFPPLAWGVRGISTSLIVGAIWHGTPLSDLAH
ncbi:hypothetical protein ABZ499_32970 [Streptomyces sp. NPDC019990]|uniref:hypothetical protein n=1 Tax=Streptomyces sp. NPDC019990 TaxID=3154693 RepID=UPI0033D453DA